MMNDVKLECFRNMDVCLEVAEVSLAVLTSGYQSGYLVSDGVQL